MKIENSNSKAHILVKPIFEAKADVVYGSRFKEGGA